MEGRAAVGRLQAPVHDWLNNTGLAASLSGPQGSIAGTIGQRASLAEADNRLRTGNLRIGRLLLGYAPPDSAHREVPRSTPLFSGESDRSRRPSSRTAAIATSAYPCRQRKYLIYIMILEMISEINL